MIVELISSPAVVSALLVLVDLVLSCFQIKKTGKVNTATTVVDIRQKDIDDMIEYHEKVLVELKKVKKG